jgi:hypothetical protein
MKVLYLLGLFISLCMTLKAQTGEDIFAAMQNLEYDKAIISLILMTLTITCYKAN